MSNEPAFNLIGMGPGLDPSLLPDTPCGAERLVIDDCIPGHELTGFGTRWLGFTDRVMGGVSAARLYRDRIDGRDCIRLTGQVSRARGGGFVQMALPCAPHGGGFDASAWRGLELLLHGNDEQYNVHLRTGDVRWYEQSYRATILVRPGWQRLRLPWQAFTPHNLTVPLNLHCLTRIGLLGWMRDFQADLALGEIALFA